MNTNIPFCQYLLRGARTAAQKAGVQVPKNLTALRSDRKQFFVEGDGIRGEYIQADNAYHAKAEYIYKLVDRNEGRI